jgi:hypothetical protein
LSFAFEVPAASLEEQQACLGEIVALVDAKLTQTAPVRLRELMWDVEDGVTEKEVAPLASSVFRQVDAALTVQPICAHRFTPEHQRDGARRAVQ